MLSYRTFNLLTRVELSRFLTARCKNYLQKNDHLHTSAGEGFYALNHHTKENVKQNIALSLYFVLILCTDFVLLLLLSHLHSLAYISVLDLVSQVAMSS